jgi:hypothetical protein
LNVMFKSKSLVKPKRGGAGKNELPMR